MKTLHGTAGEAQIVPLHQQMAIGAQQVRFVLIYLQENEQKTCEVRVVGESFVCPANSFHA